MSQVLRINMGRHVAMKTVLQDDFLRALSNKKFHVYIFLVNGIKLQGYIKTFDENALVLKRNENDEQLVFKHAISTIILSPQWHNNFRKTRGQISKKTAVILLQITRINTSGFFS